MKNFIRLSLIALSGILFVPVRAETIEQAIKDQLSHALSHVGERNYSSLLRYRVQYSPSERVISGGAVSTEYFDPNSGTTSTLRVKAIKAKTSRGEATLMYLQTMALKDRFKDFYRAQIRYCEEGYRIKSLSQ